MVALCHFSVMAFHAPENSLELSNPNAPQEVLDAEPENPKVRAENLMVFSNLLKACNVGIAISAMGVALF